jgi:predicted PurR-regulated permease PerM
MNSKDWKKWIFWFSFAVATILVYKTIDSVSTIFSVIGSFIDLLKPFIMAILVAYILYIPCKGIEKKYGKAKLKIISKHSRGLAVASVYIIIVFIILLLYNFVAPTIVESVKDLANSLPTYYNNAIDFLSKSDEDSLIGKLDLQEYVTMLQNIKIEKEILNWINLENINSYIQGIVGATNIIFDLFVTLVVSVYMLLERDDIKSFLKNLSKAMFDKKTNETIAKYYRKTNTIFFDFITSQIIDAFIVGIIISIALVIMKVKYAILLGTLIGLFNIIPYFGAIAAVLIAVIITIFTGGFMKALWVALVIVILQQIDANIINPRILGSSLNLSPILVIFAVTVGGTYFGVLGMFLGVPVVAFAKVIIVDIINYKNEKKPFLKKI